jgi:hypothetical protein
MSQNQGPNLRIRLNKELLHEVENLTEESLSLEFKVLLNDINTLTIEHWGKDPTFITSGEDIAVEIDSISINNIQLHRNLLYSCSEFYPNWRYGDSPNIVYNNCYLGYNGVWCLNLPKNPVAWIMEYIEQEMFNSAPIQVITQGQTDEDFKREFLP